jgi:hypothetical protein
VSSEIMRITCSCGKETVILRGDLTTALCGYCLKPFSVPSLIREKVFTVSTVRATSWQAWDIPLLNMVFGVTVHFTCGCCRQHSSSKGIENQHGLIDRVRCQLCGTINYL